MVDSKEIFAAATEPMETCSTSPTVKDCHAKVFSECLTRPDWPTAAPAASTSRRASMVTLMPTELPEDPLGTIVNLPLCPWIFTSTGTSDAFALAASAALAPHKKGRLPCSDGRSSAGGRPKAPWYLHESRARAQATRWHTGNQDLAPPTSAHQLQNARPPMLNRATNQTSKNHRRTDSRCPHWARNVNSKRKERKMRRKPNPPFWALRTRIELLEGSAPEISRAPSRAKDGAVLDCLQGTAQNDLRQTPEPSRQRPGPLR